MFLDARRTRARLSRVHLPSLRAHANQYADPSSVADGLSKASKTVVFVMSIAAFDEVSCGLTVDVTVGLECDCHG